jgi:CubicO group peptidase (beta-lactamase class C family)
MNLRALFRSRRVCAALLGGGVLALAATADGRSLPAATEPGMYHPDGFKRPATGDTQYDIGSVNKMFTAVLLLQFAERGLLDLDDPVSRHLPDYDGPMREATIRQLLIHTSGFLDGPDIDETRKQPELERPQSVAEQLALPTVTEAKRGNPPGTVFRYSNSAFKLLGVVVQVIAGQGYGEVALRQVFRPAGMTNSVSAEWPTGPHAAVTYMWREDQLVRPPPIHPSAFGSGAVITSVRDLLSFQCALDAGLLISPASLALMREPTLIRIGDEAVHVPYGFATMMGPFEARQKLGHQGTWPGGSAHFAHFPDDDLTLAVLTNTNLEGTVQARELGSWIAHALFGDMTPGLSRTPLPIDEEFARIATGRFQWNGFVNEATWEEGELRVRNPVTGELSGRLLRVGPLATTFVRPDVQMAEELPAYRVGNPPYELSIHSPSGDWILWFREGGMFWDIGRRLTTEPGCHDAEHGARERGMALRLASATPECRLPWTMALPGAEPSAAQWRSSRKAIVGTAAAMADSARSDPRVRLRPLPPGGETPRSGRRGRP